MQGVFRYPERLSVPLAQELVLSAGKPGFVPALKALLDYSYRDRLAQIEIPVLIVWGRNDLLVPVGDATRYRRLIGDNARVVVFEDTGHAPMLERPDALQRAAAPVPRRRSRAGVRESPATSGPVGRVIAPSEALETSLAYFASTPSA